LLAPPPRSGSEAGSERTLAAGIGLLDVLDITSPYSDCALPVRRTPPAPLPSGTGGALFARGCRRRTDADGASVQIR
jgi:hypothetical protein